MGLKENGATLVKLSVELTNVGEQIAMIYLLDASINFDILFWIFFVFGYLSAAFDPIPNKWVKMVFMLGLEAAQIGVYLGPVKDRSAALVGVAGACFAYQVIGSFIVALLSESEPPFGFAKGCGLFCIKTFFYIMMNSFSIMIIYLKQSSRLNSKWFSILITLQIFLSSGLTNSLLDRIGGLIKVSADTDEFAAKAEELKEKDQSWHLEKIIQTSYTVLSSIMSVAFIIIVYVVCIIHVKEGEDRKYDKVLYILIIVIYSCILCCFPCMLVNFILKKKKTDEDPTGNPT